MISTRYYRYIELVNGIIYFLRCWINERKVIKSIQIYFSVCEQQAQYIMNLTYLLIYSLCNVHSYICNVFLKVLLLIVGLNYHDFWLCQPINHVGYWTCMYKGELWSFYRQINFKSWTNQFSIIFWLPRNNNW